MQRGGNFFKSFFQQPVAKEKAGRNSIRTALS
jgi:hypothetical protein